MQLKIKTTTEEVITIETPQYFKKYSTVMKLSEKGLTKVGGDVIIHFKHNESTYYTDEVNDLLKNGQKATEQEFLELYQESLITINNIIHEL
jgi:DnaJ-class molecular chaperone